MHIMSTNFAKTLIRQYEYDVKLLRHKQRTPNTNDHHMSLNETTQLKFSAYATDCTVAVVVDTVHSCLSSAQKNWSIFDCFTSFVVAWSTFRILWISHTLTACKPWCCYTSNCSNKRYACSNKRRIYKTKIGSVFLFSRN